MALASTSTTTSQFHSMDCQQMMCDGGAEQYFYNQRTASYVEQAGPSPSSSPISSSASSLSSGSTSWIEEHIDHACRLLAISADPYNWNQTDVRKWLMYQQRLHQMTNPLLNKLLDYFQMDGMSLCELSVEDFQSKIYRSICSVASNCSTNQAMQISWQYASVLYNELNLWRTAISTIEADLFENCVGQQQCFMSNTCLNSSTAIEQVEQIKPPILQSVSCSAPLQCSPSPSGSCSSPGSSSLYSPPCSPPSLHQINVQSTFNTANYQRDSLNQIEPQPVFNHNQQIANGNALVQQQTNYYTQHNEQHQMQPTKHHHDQCLPLFNLFQQPDHHLQQTSDYGSDFGGTFSDDDIMSDDGFLHNQLLSAYPIDNSNIKNPQQEHSPISNNHISQQSQSPSPNLITRQSHNSSTMASSMNLQSHHGAAARPHGHTSSIQLWQFLKELLSQPHLHGNAIRWLERPRGVFKIEDSVRVARLWGERKNRPAMNYDKLSRSIRQYYKKGIMKKTERAQRLVYQFCKPYSL